MKREFRFERCIECRQQHRHVLGLASGHDRIDRHLLDGAWHEVRRDGADHLVCLARGALQHAQDAIIGWRYDRQTIRPAAIETRFDRIVPFTDFDLAGLDGRVAESRE